jgi:hypothetical protein
MYSNLAKSNSPPSALRTDCIIVLKGMLFISRYVPNFAYEQANWGCAMEAAKMLFYLSTYNMIICSRPFCPKLEIQHNRRDRGVLTLTGGEMTIREKKRW